MPEQLSATLKRLDLITDEKRLIEVLGVGSAYVSGRDEATRKYVALELADIDTPERWRVLLSAT